MGFTLTSNCDTALAIVFLFLKSKLKIFFIALEGSQDPRGERAAVF